MVTYTRFLLIWTSNAGNAQLGAFGSKALKAFTFKR